MIIPMIIQNILFIKYGSGKHNKKINLTIQKVF